MRWIFACLVALFALTPSDLAIAGSCPPCTTHADCTAVPGSLCVLHDNDVGCGALRQLCCPGQGCALTGGIPSCLGTTCTLVGGVTDAGPLPDSGPVPPIDSGVPTDTGICACDVDFSCTAGCACDIECGAGCLCDTTFSCDPGCSLCDPDCAGIDAGPVDGALQKDAAPVADVGSADARPRDGSGGGGGSKVDRSGCACSATEPLAGGYGLLGIVFVGLMARRRR